ncbi:phosphoglycerate kinase [Sinorhizobium medicae]|uniref:phosphoglycerate kinase n=1 Tax=Sinorhizobium medicae TaxID=110321 RepID=UPI002B1BDC0F|nr:phosphoglycerate kinase [Sinorhizobium medicae]WQO45899.1 phosphoglycerate kinase [Sinorhizobium medicae]
MGLDMYAFTTTQPPQQNVDFEPAEQSRLHYWRKHPNLHGWMEELYRTKGGTEHDFNFVNLLLTKEDLDQLEAAIQSGTLPKTVGFFFGESDGSETDDDLQFVANAREALAAGLTVFYSSWW